MGKNTMQYDKAKAERRAKDAKRKREKRAELREAAGLVASEIAKPAKERVKLPSVGSPAEAAAAFGPGTPMANEAARVMRPGTPSSAFRPTNEPGRAPHISVGYEKHLHPVRMTFTGKLTEEGQRAVKAALDEPAPVRLTLAALAQAFDEACAGVDLAEGALENATRIRDKAKTALDQACARRANGEQA